ncbi:MAG: Nitric oxide reductase [Alphaproteobacteria bacterium ADurb.Bin438]|nr:MAG: Nitric oxide reductase [Alphaproteobacteria bacterium ADurb.Bin438]
MNKIELVKDVYAVGVKDWNIKNFHGYAITLGITYNAYVVKGSEKVALIDTVKEKFTDEYIARVKATTDLDKVDYVICNHVEMDHSGAIPHLMKLLRKDAILVTSMKGKENLEAHYDMNGVNIQVVKTGDILSLGDRNFKFVNTPMLHWPDSMETYLIEDKILFSNDGFGQHYTGEMYFDDRDECVIFDQAAKYYANILQLFDKPANAALNILKDVEINMIAPAHGVIFRKKENIEKILKKYQEWANGVNQNKAVVIYDSMWGATEIMADKVKEAFEDKGVEVIFRSARDHEFSDIAKDILEAKYIAIGSATLNNGLMPNIIRILGYFEGLKPLNKKGFAFGSYGWKGDVLTKVENFFDAVKWEKMAPYCALKYRPKEDGLKGLYDTVYNNIKD